MVRRFSACARRRFYQSPSPREPPSITSLIGLRSTAIRTCDSLCGMAFRQLLTTRPAFTNLLPCPANAASDTRVGALRGRQQKRNGSGKFLILGTRPDRQVARLLGKSLGTVAARRRKLGLACHYEHRPWTEHELALLGVKPDE